MRRLKKSVKRTLTAAVSAVAFFSFSIFLLQSCSQDLLGKNELSSEEPSETSTNSSSLLEESSSNLESETSSASISANDIIAISLTTYHVTLLPGESIMPIVTMYPQEAENKEEIWKSSDEAVASVDQYGNITGISEGSCTVTVTSKANPSVFAEVSVIVEKGSSNESGLTYINGILIVNKTYSVPASYAPGVDPEAQAAFDKMASAAAAEGLNIYISSGYRSYDYQKGLYERYVARDGQAAADTYSARPGHSEHQTGLAFDLNTISDEFADTAEGKWVAEHCHEYGFIIRYQKDKEDITGYKYEPWHIRYLGVETATAVYQSGLCLEEYLGITSEYQE